MKIKKGDKVQVIAGQDRGTVGEVKLVMPRSNRIIVEGVNVRKKHEKPSQINPDGGIVNKEMPINASNVKLQEGKTKKASKKAADKKSKGGKK
ncbi:MAG: 50S ribosomal protein L24 [Erysipelotrichaceae bacterium]|nr:50S ribosomal protein L24 [Erysipelotrichaceae bacterium]